MNDILPLRLSRGSLALPYDESDIRRCLGYELDKGRSYQRSGAARDLHADKGGQRLIADVQGTRRRPYRVFAEIKPGPRIRLSGQCSCPVVIDCKHVAAVLLEALSNPPQGIVAAGALGGSVAGWLDRLRRGSSKPVCTPEEIIFRVDTSPHPGQPFTLDLRVARVLKSGAYGANRSCPSRAEWHASGIGSRPVVTANRAGDQPQHAMAFAGLRRMRTKVLRFCGEDYHPTDDGARRVR